MITLTKHSSSAEIKKYFTVVLIIEDIYYQVLRKNAENPKGGRPSKEYRLTVSCMEFFIARKVRDVFEVYRKVFHKTAEQKEIASEPKHPKPISPRTLQLMKVDTANWLMKNLNYSDTSKLALAKAIADPLELRLGINSNNK